MSASPSSLGEDEVYGGPGADELYDAGGRNIIKGGPGNDSIAGHGRLFGGAGDDRIDGETGIVGGPRIIAGGVGEDRITSQRETDDTIHVTDGERDAVDDCGEGTDTVYFDEGLDEVDPGTCEDRIPR